MGWLKTNSSKDIAPIAVATLASSRCPQALSHCNLASAKVCDVGAKRWPWESPPDLAGAAGEEGGGGGKQATPYIPRNLRISRTDASPTDKTNQAQESTRNVFRPQASEAGSEQQLQWHRPPLPNSQGDRPGHTSISLLRALRSRGLPWLGNDLGLALIWFGNELGWRLIDFGLPRGGQRTLLPKMMILICQLSVIIFLSGCNQVYNRA